MSITSDFVRWQQGCCDGGAFGISNSDTFYCGYRSYTQPYPCPNGLNQPQLTFSQIQMLPSYRRRIEKAKRDIELRQSEIRVRELAESITEDELLNDIQEIRTWALSLQKTEISPNGWTKLTRHETA